MSYTKPAWITIVAEAITRSGNPPPPLNRFPGKFLFKKFRTEAGSAAMNIDGSTPVTFFVEAPAAMYVERINLAIIDAAMTPNKFGGLAALIVGMRIYVTDKANVELIDFLDGDTLNANYEFALLAGIDSVIGTVGAGDDCLPVRWTIRKAGAKLRLNTGDRFILLVQDNLTGITFFEAMLQGTLI